MNSTRIEVPLTLPAPHFDDERTVATARQVKPIGRARVSESWRKVRTLVPLIFLATLCGALGAAGLNYYEDWHRGESIGQPVISHATAEPKIEPSPVVATSATPTPTVAEQRDTVTAEVKAEATPIAEPQAKAVTDTPVEKAPTGQGRKAIDVEAAKLTRKRRVNSTDENAMPANKKGAGRIVDIFSGPNPF
jgi:hypothetical protein